jgi:type II secretory pathway pseudopilin PulG
MCEGCHARRSPTESAQGGFTYLGMLLILVLVGIALASAGLVWHTASVHEKEEDLLFVGEQYRQAIASYYVSGQGELPKKLADLVLDPRFASVKRHLRRIYPDPMTGTKEWGLVKAGDRILGVYSLAPGKPLKEIRVSTPGADGGIAVAYSEWKFVFNPGAEGQGPNPDSRGGLPVVGSPNASDAPASNLSARGDR